jgi:endonuclease/exonuclease/phosphatase family metal-dependent hydrolase
MTIPATPPGRGQEPHLDELAAADGENWRRYAGGAGAVWRVLTGAAGRGEGVHTIAAAMSGHLLAVMLAGAAMFLMVNVLAVAVLLGAVVLGVATNLRSVRYAATQLLRGRERHDGTPATATLRVCSWNLLNTNTAENTAQAVSAANAQVVVLFETEQRHLDVVQELSPGTKWRELASYAGDGRIQHDGIAAYCSHPEASAEIVMLAGMRAVRIETELDGEKLAIWGFRPEAPIGRSRRARWSQQLAALHDALRAEPLEYVLVGDLNSCIYHLPLLTILDAEQLDSAVPIWRGTWRHPQLGWRARIDHALITTGLVAQGSVVKEPYGSDHRMLCAEISRRKVGEQSGKRTSPTSL